MGVTIVYFWWELDAWRNGKPFRVFDSGSDSSLLSAGLALVFFGVPALRYAWTGRSASEAQAAATPAVTAAVVHDASGRIPWHSVVQPGRRYRVIKAFTDHDRERHPEGEEWTFLRNAFLPYEDGMTFFVSVDGAEESQIRLQWRAEEQAHILDYLHEYVAPV